MKALILAAGRGTRISKFIKDIPKSTLPIYDNKPLIRHTVEVLLSRGIEPILCLGYKQGCIKEALGGAGTKILL